MPPLASPTTRQARPTAGPPRSHRARSNTCCYLRPRTRVPPATPLRRRAPPRHLPATSGLASPRQSPASGAPPPTRTTYVSPHLAVSGPQRPRLTSASKLLTTDRICSPGQNFPIDYAARSAAAGRLHPSPGQIRWALPGSIIPDLTRLPRRRLELARRPRSPPQRLSQPSIRREPTGCTDPVWFDPVQPEPPQAGSLHHPIPGIPNPLIQTHPHPALPRPDRPKGPNGEPPTKPRPVR